MSLSYRLKTEVRSLFDIIDVAIDMLVEDRWLEQLKYWFRLCYPGYPSKGGATGGGRVSFSGYFFCISFVFFPKQ